VVNPRTVNSGLIVPLTGADVDLWGQNDVNPNMVSVDGLFAGVQTIALTSGPVTLTSPAGFTATPGPGPTQAENRVLRFTGALTGNVLVTLPLPGSYIIENLTTGAFVVQLAGALSTVEVIAPPQGSSHLIYNDGTHVRFSDLGKVGELEFWAGINTMPAWVSSCSIPPYLLCDGAASSIATFPYLGARLGATFGGNGTTTFGSPDLRGRVPLAFDGTGVRITIGGCGIDGRTMGAALDTQYVNLTQAQMPVHFHSAGIFDAGHVHSMSLPSRQYGNAGSNSTPVFVGIQLNNGSDGNVFAALASTGVRVNSTNGLDTTYNAGSGSLHNNVQPSQVAGIWVIKT
jgi:microcystin-dependent protein